jgi:transcription elongation factor GreA
VVLGAPDADSAGTGLADNGRLPHTRGPIAAGGLGAAGLVDGLGHVAVSGARGGVSHGRPSGERPAALAFAIFLRHAMDKMPITAKGFAALEEELKQRQQVERPRIIEAISEARSHGDLSENAEYHAAKENQSLNEGRIQELESMIARADIIDVSKLSGDKIKFGATVKLVDEDTEQERIYQIVGDPEADVKSGRVSISSPVARALIGKGVGDTVEVSTPGGGKSYEIVEVAFR